MPSHPHAVVARPRDVVRLGVAVVGLGPWRQLVALVASLAVPAGLVAIAALAPFGRAQAAGPAERAPTAAPTLGAVQRSERDYPVPARLRLQRADGVHRSLRDLLWDGRPVVLTFMYSSCNTVCPITNQTLVTFERLLGPEAARVNTVSISIDPDHDSVRKLAEYARATGAKGGYYTSDPATSESVQRVFDAWRGDKMNHEPVFLLSLGPGQRWVRLDGLVTPKQLLAEYRRLVPG